jgi:hypothetical protein
MPTQLAPNGGRLAPNWRGFGSRGQHPTGWLGAGQLHRGGLDRASASWRQATRPALAWEGRDGKSLAGGVKVIM